MNFEDVLENYAGKRVLITGGAGCIGSNLVKALTHAEAEKVIVLDDFSSSPRWNLPNHPEIMVVNGSVLSEENLNRAFSTKPQYVFYLAAHFIRKSFKLPSNIWGEDSLCTSLM